MSIQPGPCVICGGTNYELSMGGPTLCPKCDCGHFDAATVEQQAKVISTLRAQLAAERERCAKIADAYAERCDRGSALSSMAEDSWGAVAARAIAKAIREQS